jgi:hypothetical protein
MADITDETPLGPLATPSTQSNRLLLLVTESVNTSWQGTRFPQPDPSSHVQSFRERSTLRLNSRLQNSL